MDDEKILKLSFEFLEHMSKLTDVVESMVHKMEEMDNRIRYLESQQPRKGTPSSEDDDVEWILV